MLSLDHASLESFEPVISGLIDRLLGKPLQGLASAGLRPGDEWHTEAAQLFRPACLPSFKDAQQLIGTGVLDLQEQITLMKREEIAERQRRNVSGTKQINDVLSILQNRQLVLRRLADAMLWVLLWPDRWVLRRLRIEGGIRPVNSGTLKPLLEQMSHENAKSDETFWLVCDLTTIAQLGDVIIAKWVPSRNSMKIIVGELKVGRVNVLLHDLLHGPKASDINAAIAKMSRELNADPTSQVKVEKHLRKQAVRMARQEKRLNDFNRVIATDEGVHPVSGRRFRMTKRARVCKDYRDQIRALISRAKLDGSSGLTLDRCLHLVALFGGSRDSTDKGLKIAHSFYHMRSRSLCGLDDGDLSEQEEIDAIIKAPKAVNLVNFGMRNAVALPPLLWYPCSLVLDALMGRVQVFAQFDHAKFFELASKVGLTLKFIRGRGAAQIESAKLSGPLIEYTDPCYVEAENSQGKSMFFGARFFSRVYTELIRPRDLFSMMQDLINEAPTRELATRIA